MCSMFKKDVEGNKGAGLNERKYGMAQSQSSQEKYNEDWELIKKVMEHLNTMFGERILNERHDKKFIEEFRDAVQRLVQNERDIQANIQKKQKIIQTILDEILGLGPLEPLLSDKTVTEIMCVGPQKIFVERNGLVKLEPDIYFNDELHLRNTITNKIAAPLGRRIDDSNPTLDARLTDGSRVNATIPPISIESSLTIRKHSNKRWTVQDYYEYGTANIDIIEWIKACVEAKLNIVVSGGTGTGKTTCLNIVSNFIPEDERIVSIEDTREIKLSHQNWVALEARPENSEGKGEVTIRDLVKNSLRMRPDRIIVGECRSGEALDMLQAMNTGHEGSLTTGHANTPKDMLARLETMVLMAGMDLPVKAIREQIASAVDIIIQISRMKDGTRKITNITHVIGLGKDGFKKYKSSLNLVEGNIDNIDDDDIDLKDAEADRIYIQDIFCFKQRGLNAMGKISGEFINTGYIPKSIIKRMEANGVPVPRSIYNRPKGV